MSITCDASDTALGAVLQQDIDGQWCPISYFSKQLHSAQKHYSMFDWELLAIYQAVKHFRHFVEGWQFVIFTDHKPLTCTLLASSDRYALRQVQHLDYISQFTLDIWHVKGAQNRPADALSLLGAIALATNASTMFDFWKWQQPKRMTLIFTFCNLHHRSFSGTCRCLLLIVK